MVDRLSGYLRAVEGGPSAVRRFHDRLDVKKGRLSLVEFNRRWGGGVGSKKRLTPHECGHCRNGGD